MGFRTLESKDPHSTGIDYMVDLAALRNGRGLENYLQDGEYIHSITDVFADDPALNVDDFYPTDSNSSITIILSGGTLGTKANVTARFVTTLGRGDDITFRIFIENK